MASRGACPGNAAQKQSVIKATIGTDDAAFMQALSWKDIQELLA